MKTIHTNPDNSQVTISGASGSELSIGQGVTLGSNIKVSGSCTIGDGATVENDVQLDDAVIGANAHIAFKCKIRGIIPAESVVETEASVWMPTMQDNAARCPIRIGDHSHVDIGNASELTYLHLGSYSTLNALTVAMNVILRRTRNRLVNMDQVRDIDLPNSRIDWDGTRYGLRNLTGSDTIFTFFGQTLVLHGDKLYNGPEEELPLVKPLLKHIKALFQRAQTAEGRARAAEARVAKLEAQLAQYGSFDD